MNEVNRLRLERLAARYEQRIHAADATGEAELRRAFEEFRLHVAGPAMEEIAAELRRAGHAPRVVLDEGENVPSIELFLGLRGATASRNTIGFTLVRMRTFPLQILAYLEVNPPKFDLERFDATGEVGPDRVEQLLVDAVEHIVSCNAP